VLALGESFSANHNLANEIGTHPYGIVNVSPASPTDPRQILAPILQILISWLREPAEADFPFANSDESYSRCCLDGERYEPQALLVRSIVLRHAILLDKWRQQLHGVRTLDEQLLP
jgi:hypothetical protein